MHLSSLKATAPSTFGVYPWWLLWIGFVVYGSLVPLDFNPVAFDQALSRFLNISLLSVGTAGRADWIANGVLYVPVGFLTAVLLLGRGTSLPVRFLASVGALAFSISLAVGIEFLQVFFPPRTVSLNDLVAECTGGAIGLGLALMGATTFRRLLVALSENLRQSGGLLLVTYALAYLAFSLFPYDVLISQEEIRNKVLVGQWGWFVANRSSVEGFLAFAVKLAAETLMAIPLGLLLGFRKKSSQPVTLSHAFVSGILLGLTLEILQFFIVSGVSQGLSVVTRAAGVCLGASIWNRRQRIDPQKLERITRQLALPLALPYLALLLAISGWFSSRWLDVNGALARLTNDVHFVPFYYHYFTTEAHALFSLASVALLYVPVGILVWAHQLQPRHAAGFAMLLAGVVESGKLFAMAAHPDPTNLLIAGLAAFMAVKLINLPARNESKSTPQTHDTRSSGISRLIAIGILSLVFLWVLAFPTQPLLLGLLFTAYALVSWGYPMVVFAAIPAAVPLLDLAPWSGRFFLDELDGLILLSLVIGYARLPRASTSSPHKVLLFCLVTLLSVSFAISTWRALLPWQMPDVNAFNNYLSPFNALRIGKGALWACLLLPLMQRANTDGRKVSTMFGAGMIAGLAGTVLFVLWERASFTDLFNYASQYRITGPISAMHTGGAYIECFLTIATPFLLQQILQTRRQWCRLLGGLLMLGATYALMVTFSRNGYAAFAVMLFLLLLVVMRQPGPRRVTAVISLLLVGASLAVAWPVLYGSFAQSRLATVDHDLGVRETHWAEALAIRDRDWSTLLLGMGVGRFPATRYWNSPENDRIASYQLVQTKDNLALRIGTGQPTYLEQIIRIQPQQNYTLQLDLKSKGDDNRAKVMICHKWLLTSEDCTSQVFLLENHEKWQHFERKITSGMLGADPWYARRPVKLTLQSASKSAVEFDNIQLIGADGLNHIANGNFNQGLDHWNLTSDHHLAWHTKAMPVAVLFDQGILGLIALGAILLAACWRAIRYAWRGNLAAGSVLSALAGFMVLGLFDTLIDSPRFLMLLLTLSWLALMRGPDEPMATPR